MADIKVPIQARMLINGEVPELPQVMDYQPNQVRHDHLPS